MPIKSMNDDELIKLWEQITVNIDPTDTEKPSLGTRRLSMLGEIHQELIARGYKADDGSWAKNEEAGTS